MFPRLASARIEIPLQVPSGGESQAQGDMETSRARLLVWCLLLVLHDSLSISTRRRVLLPIYPLCCSALAHLLFILVPPGRGMALPKLPSAAGL